MKQATKRFISLTVGLALVAGSFVMYFNFIRPANEEAQLIKADLFARRAFIEQQRSAVDQVKQLIATYEGEGQLQDVISRALPLSADVAGALAQLNGIIRNNNLDVDSFGIEIVEPRRKRGVSATEKDTGLVKSLGTVFLTANIKGSYESFKDFLAMLETNIRIFHLEALSLSGRDAKNETYLFSVRVKTYYQRL